MRSSTSSRLYQLLLGRCRLDGSNLDRWRIFLLENNIVVLDKDVAQNGELKTAIAKASNALVVLVLEDQISSRHFIAVSTNGKTQILQGRSIAGDGVGSITVVSTVQCLGNLVSLGVGKQQEGGASVDDGGEGVNRGAAYCSRVNRNSPETLRVINRDGGKSSGELGVIDASKEVFATSTIGFLAKEDAKNRLRDQTLRNEVIDRSLDARDAHNAVKSETQETVSRIRGKLRRDVLGKFNCLTLDCKATKCNIVSSTDTR